MKMKKTKNVLLLMALLCGIGVNLWAQSPRISIQGILKDANGTAVSDGTYAIIFRLYDQATGGTPLWEEQANVEVVGGIYSHYLGSVTPLVTSNFASIVYVAVRVGAHELMPRSELTYAPYTMSSAGVAGLENVVPSVGTVGIGTNLPDDDFKLHVHDTDGDARILIEGGNRSTIELRKGGQEASIGYHSSADSDLSIQPGANKTLFYWGNNVKAAVTTEGFEVDRELRVGSSIAARIEFERYGVVSGGIGIPQGSDFLAMHVNQQEQLRIYNNGNTEVRGGLRVFGGVTHGSGGHAYLNSGGTGTSGGGGTIGAAIYTPGDIHAGTFRAFSDRRIKHNLRLSNPVEDLNRLMQLQVTNYEYIDSYGRGIDVKKGFIAQEVETVFPEAVRQGVDFIPNVYTLASKIGQVGSQLQLQLTKEHGLQPGDELRLILEEDVKEITVVSVIDPLTFSVAWDGEVPDKVFVYGKKVSDFRQVDYDQLHTLSISATQALVRRVEELERENGKLHEENRVLRTDIEGLDARMQRLEKAATSSLVEH